MSPSIRRRSLDFLTVLRDTVVDSTRAPRMGNIEEEELIRLSVNDKAKENGWSHSPSPSPSSALPPSLPQRPRLLDKNGRTLLALVELPQRLRNDIRNWFHLLIECTWRTVLILFAVGYVSTWIIFAFLYYVIVIHSSQVKGESCIENVDDFLSAFLFSMESQHTIGYGSRHMNTNCPLACIILAIQCIIGVFVQTILGGVIIAKVLRPKKRKQEVRFSRFACIGPVDDEDRRPTLMIRIADIQDKLFLAESHVRLYMAMTRLNEKGEKILLGLKDMNVGYDSGWDRVLLLWPVVVRHVIDEKSPLFGLTKETLAKQDFELIMTVEGIVEATGMTFQARTSFLPQEIIWGEKFKPMILSSEKRRQFEIHYHMFDQTEKVDDWEWPVDEEMEEHEYKSGFI